MPDQSARAAAAVDSRRLWEDLRNLAQLGARADGGVGRLALDENDVKARLWLVEQGRALGCSVRMDAAANVFLRLPGGDENLPPVVTGSHMDSQPAGGAYDGAYGVLAGLAALRAVHEARIATRRPLEVVAWTNEEGVRFSPGTSGSACFVGVRSLEETRALTDGEGISFGEAADACLARLEAQGVPTADFATPMSAFVELHIEQGPVLERAGARAGVVTGIQGVSWFEFTVRGTANHAGTTPRAARRDALEGACALAVALREQARDDADETRFTIGRFRVSPDSVNTIPDEAVFTVDLRDPDQARLDALEATFRDLAAGEWAGCSVEVTRLSRIDPVVFPDAVTGAVAEAAERDLCMEAPRLMSGAFHDAIHLARHCPTGMIFIPCKDGVSHHPAESITPDQAEDGARLLAATLVRLAEVA
ncbi:N-carbamoyl-L-amino-acid hydrolase [Natronocella acetinitrilica]|uniref:N-carbamoyl-L-amino-acid hydrolase n=1 Tax=Natronocella acetinitrilica TaxID=414046 RepID=A0AAE3G648_9GAMM|nr:M20 family metallo-hydrolase [Natronocella acetinitrilica]MCP1676485.1 N-carbamoyl-L-amino-acid hydrolase [Natronocella acetinitrilica]